MIKDNEDKLAVLEGMEKEDIIHVVERVKILEVKT